MWGLIIILLVGGSLEIKVYGFNDETTCNKAKSNLVSALSKEVPDAKVSLTCVKLNKFGGIV